MKICYKCKKEKELQEFNKCSSSKDGRQGKCRDCEKQYVLENKERKKQKSKEYREKNKEIIKEKNKTWRRNNPEVVKKMSKEYNEKSIDKIRIQKRNYYNKNKKERREYQNNWLNENREKMREYRREYMKKYRRENPNYAIRHRVSTRLRELLINGKEQHTEEYLDCTIGYLKEHLEKLFTDGMSWTLFLEGKIHIDHIKPCCCFDLTQEKDRKECFHWKNLQPLWKEDNLSKISQDLALKRNKDANSSVLQ